MGYNTDDISPYLVANDGYLPATLCNASKGDEKLWDSSAPIESST